MSTWLFLIASILLVGCSAKSPDKLDQKDDREPVSADKVGSAKEPIKESTKEKTPLTADEPPKKPVQKTSDSNPHKDKPATIRVRHLHMGELAVGQVGPMPGPAEFIVVQVLGDDELLFILKNDAGQSSSRLVLQGYSTNGLADGSQMDLSEGDFVVAGTKRFPGGQTLFVIKPAKSVEKTK